MYSIIHLPEVIKSKQHDFFTPDQKYIIKQTDLVTQADGDEWIKANIHDDIENHWVIKTSSMLKFNRKQLENMYLDSNLNLEVTSSK